MLEGGICRVVVQSHVCLIAIAHLLSGCLLMLSAGIGSGGLFALAACDVDG
jgi:hypothetical protein